MVPAGFVFLESLPMTPNGKVNRRALPVLDKASNASEAIYVAPRSDTESTLVGIWRDILHLEQVGIYDNFFDLGGHSLLATQVVSRVHDSFGINLQVRSLFEAPTVADLSVIVVQRLAERTDDETLEQLIGELDQLSEDEIQRLLGVEVDIPGSP